MASISPQLGFCCPPASKNLPRGIFLAVCERGSAFSLGAERNCSAVGGPFCSARHPSRFSLLFRCRDARNSLKMGKSERKRRLTCINAAGRDRKRTRRKRCDIIFIQPVLSFDALMPLVGVVRSPTGLQTCSIM